MKINKNFNRKNDMKNFIDALVYFISMSLIVDDAETMKSKKVNSKNE